MATKYTNYALNIVDNNWSRIERLKDTEWVGQFAPIVDHVVPILVCSMVAKTSSYICQPSKTGDVID